MTLNMQVTCVFAVVLLLNFVLSSNATVLATAGYVFSSPRIRTFLINSGLGNLISRKSQTLYDVSNFRYASDRGTDIKKAEMGDFEITEVNPKKKTQRSGIIAHEQNEEDRLYSEKLFSVLTEMDRNGCVSRLLCEIGADPKSFGITGLKINHYLKSVPPVTWNSATFPYLEAFQGGLGNRKYVCGDYYKTCTSDLRRVIKYLWPFLNPIGLKLASGL